MKKLLYILVISVIFGLTSKFLIKSDSQKMAEVLNQANKYVYDSCSGEYSSVALVILDLKYKDQLIFFYKRACGLAKGTIDAFPLKSIPPNLPVYVIGYTSDSTLVKIRCLYKSDSNKKGTLIEAYVSPLTLHDNPPKLRSLRT